MYVLISGFVFLSLKLSEMTADLAEEHSTATLATERLEAEQSERMRLEKERGELEVNKKIIFNILILFSFFCVKNVETKHCELTLLP